MPPTTVTKDARGDIMFISEVNGAGEIAISDERTTEPDFHELAHLVHDARHAKHRALKPGKKGALKAGNDADILLLEKETLDLLEVISGGKRLFKDGKIAFQENFLKGSSRNVKLKGEKA